MNRSTGSGHHSPELLSPGEREEMDQPSAGPSPAPISSGRLNDLLIYNFFMRKGWIPGRQAELGAGGVNSRFGEPPARFTLLEGADYPSPEKGQRKSDWGVFISGSQFREEYRLHNEHR